jgi:hypothetical protein
MHQIAQDTLRRHGELKEASLISQSMLDEVVAAANAAAIDLRNPPAPADGSAAPHRRAARRGGQSPGGGRAEPAGAQPRPKYGLRLPGRCLAVNVAPGDRSNLGVVLVERGRRRAIEVRVTIPDRYAARFDAWQGADDGSASPPTAGIFGRLADGSRLPLSRMARQVRTGQGGVDAFFRLRAGAGAPALGRVVNLRIELPEEADVVALPIGSLYDNNHVYAVADNRLQAVAVERVGELHTAAGEFRVLVRAAELTAGRPVITTQLPKASTGLLVEPS